MYQFLSLRIPVIRLNNSYNRKHGLMQTGNVVFIL